MFLFFLCLCLCLFHLCYVYRTSVNHAYVNDVLTELKHQHYVAAVLTIAHKLLKRMFLLTLASQVWTGL